MRHVLSARQRSKRLSWVRLTTVRCPERDGLRRSDRSTRDESRRPPADLVKSRERFNSNKPDCILYLHVTPFQFAIELPLSITQQRFAFRLVRSCATLQPELSPMCYTLSRKQGVRSQRSNRAQTLTRLRENKDAPRRRDKRGTTFPRRKRFGPLSPVPPPFALRLGPAMPCLDMLCTSGGRSGREPASCRA